MNWSGNPISLWTGRGSLIRGINGRTNDDREKDVVPLFEFDLVLEMAYQCILLYCIKCIRWLEMFNGLKIWYHSSPVWNHKQVLKDVYTIVTHKVVFVKAISKRLTTGIIKELYLLEFLPYGLIWGQVQLSIFVFEASWLARFEKSRFKGVNHLGLQENAFNQKNTILIFFFSGFVSNSVDFRKQQAQFPCTWSKHAANMRQKGWY